MSDLIELRKKALENLAKLKKANSNLNVSPSPTPSISPPKKIIAINKPPVEIEGLSTKQTILRKIRHLRAEQSDLSNTLYSISPNLNCKELTQNIVSIGREIESLWSQYRGNKALEETKVIVEKSPELLKVEYELKKLREERSKLNAKLRQKGSARDLIAKWDDRLGTVQLIIEDLEVKQKLLKGEQE
jgi:hypothetical protein